MYPPVSPSPAKDLTSETDSSPVVHVGSDVAAPEARYYAEAFQSRGVLVTVEAKTARSAQCAQSVMAKYGALAPEHGVA